MQGCVPAVRRGVALLILSSLLVVPALADEPTPGPPPPPEARIGVPIGVTSADETPSVWELFVIWLQARISVPIG